MNILSGTNLISLKNVFVKGFSSIMFYLTIFWNIIGRLFLFFPYFSENILQMADLVKNTRDQSENVLFRALEYYCFVFFGMLLSWKHQQYKPKFGGRLMQYFHQTDPMYIK